MDPAAVETHNLKEGRRLLCEDHCGTIRYVGEVPPTKGEIEQ